MRKCENHTFREKSLLAEKLISAKSVIFLKCWFSWKWPPQPMKTLGNTWYFWHWRKVDFLCEKVEFHVEDLKFPKKCKILKMFSIFWEFSNIFKPTGAGKVRFLRFHQKVRISLKWLKYLKFHENCGNLVKSATLPPMSKIPSITKRFYRYFRYFSRKYLRFSDFHEI